MKLQKMILPAIATLLAACATTTQNVSQTVHQSAKENGTKYGIKSTLNNEIIVSHKSIFNPELTRELARSIVLGDFAQSKIVSSRVSLAKLTWIEENFGVRGAINLTEDSDIYVVNVSGDIKWPYPGGDTSKDGQEAVIAISVEDGGVLAAKMLK